MAKWNIYRFCVSIIPAQIAHRKKRAPGGIFFFFFWEHENMRAKLNMKENARRQTTKCVTLQNVKQNEAISEQPQTCIRHKCKTHDINMSPWCVLSSWQVGVWQINCRSIAFIYVPGNPLRLKRVALRWRSFDLTCLIDGRKLLTSRLWFLDYKMFYCRFTIKPEIITISQVSLTKTGLGL